MITAVYNQFSKFVRFNAPLLNFFTQYTRTEIRTCEQKSEADHDAVTD